MDLTIGPNAFFWTAEAVRAFYRAVAASPVSRRRRVWRLQPCWPLAVAVALIRATVVVAEAVVVARAIPALCM